MEKVTNHGTQITLGFSEKLIGSKSRPESIIVSLGQREKGRVSKVPGQDPATGVKCGQYKRKHKLLGRSNR